MRRKVILIKKNPGVGLLTLLVGRWSELEHENLLLGEEGWWD